MAAQGGKGADEYRLPHDFFQRTYLTSGLSRLLSDALLRLNGDGGSPVVDLQTNFGGGKTHSLLALYHLFSGTPYAELGKAVEALVLNTRVEHKRMCSGLCWSASIWLRPRLV